MMSSFNPKNAVVNIVQSRAGGAVQRCHGIRHIGSYSNAEHTWGVLLLLWHIHPEHFGAVAPFALSHDVPEFIFGDVPAPTMRYVPGLREQLGEYEDFLNASYGNMPEGSLQELDPEGFAALKDCDRLDLWFWCVEQRALGNMFAYECQKELERYFEQGGLTARAMEVYHAAQKVPLLPAQAGVAEAIVGEVKRIREQQ